MIAALYSPNLYGQNQKTSRPHNWVVINVPGTDGNNRLVLLEVNRDKNNVEVVHWHYIDDKGLEKIKKQAAREDGQLLILPSVSTEEAGALSGPTSGLAGESISNRGGEDKALKPAETTPASAPQKTEANPPPKPEKPAAKEGAAKEEISPKPTGGAAEAAKPVGEAPKTEASVTTPAQGAAPGISADDFVAAHSTTNDKGGRVANNDIDSQGERLSEGMRAESVWKDSSGKEREWPGFVSPEALSPKEGLVAAVRGENGGVLVGRIAKLDGENVEIVPYGAEDEAETRTFPRAAIFGVRDPAAVRDSMRSDPALRRIDAAYKKAKTAEERNALKEKFAARVAELRKQLEKAAERPAEYRAWLEKYKMKDTDKRFAEWQRKQSGKVKKTASKVFEEGQKNLAASPNAKTSGSGNVIVYTPKDGDKPFKVRRASYEHGFRGANRADNETVGRHIGETLDGSAALPERSEGVHFRMAKVKIGGEEAHVLFTITDKGELENFDVLKGFNTKRDPEGIRDSSVPENPNAFEVVADSIANLEVVWQERFRPHPYPGKSGINYPRCLSEPYKIGMK